MKPLDGVRVIELTTAWAGPFVGRFLGAFGADVIKFESAGSVDIWRGPFPLAWGTRNLPEGVDRMTLSVDVAPNFNSLNRNKRGVAVDLSTPRGRALFLELAGDADVFVSNMTQRVLPNLGLGYETLRESNERLVVLNMPALGASGPYMGAAGYGTIIEGMGGVAARFGYRHEQARISPTYYPDPVAGIHATLAVLAALRRRESSGEGCLIDLSQQEATWMQLGEGIALRSREHREPGRLGNAEPGCVPSGLYPTADGRWLAVVVRDDQELARLVEAAGRPLAALAGVSAVERLDERDRIDGVVAAWTRTLPLDELVALLRKAGVPAGPVRTHRDVVADETLRRLDLLEELDHPVTGRQPYLRIPVRLDGRVIDSRRPAPPFGHHTAEVLRTLLGLDEADIAALERDGVVAGVPALLRSGD